MRSRYLPTAPAASCRQAGNISASVPRCLASHDSTSPISLSTWFSAAMIVNPAFFTDVDRARYQHDLHEVALREGRAVHAYVLMTNHLHLLGRRTDQPRHAITRTTPRALRQRSLPPYRHPVGRALQIFTARQGNLSSALLSLYRTQPRPRPHDRRSAGIPLVKPRTQCLRPRRPADPSPPAYLALGSTDGERHRTCRAIAMENLSRDHLDAIRIHLQRQHTRLRSLPHSYPSAPLAPRRARQNRPTEENAFRPKPGRRKCTLTRAFCFPGL